MVSEALTIVAGRIAVDVYGVLKGIAGQQLKKAVLLKRVSDGLEDHFSFLSGWSQHVALEDMSQPRSLKQVFIDLDLNVRVRAERGEDEGDRTFKVSELSTKPWNIVLVGDPGAGKTTSLKKLTADRLAGLSGRKKEKPTPLLIRCRVLREGRTLWSELAAAVGLSLEDLSSDGPSAQRRTLRRLLKELDALVMIDGFDEISSAIEHEFKKELEELVLSSDGYRVLVTSRTALSMENSRVLEVSPLSGRQVGLFARKWLGRTTGGEFLEQVRATPYAGSEIRPLMLAHLCIIFSRTREIPEKPRSVYRLIIRLLLRDWDSQRGVVRASRYSSFQVDEKEEFLEAIAYQLSLMEVRGEFGHEVLEEAYSRICARFDLPARQADLVARELESHTGLLVRSGPDSYEFAHRSLQEYLAAQFISRSPVIPLEPDEVGGVPGELAIATALSTAPDVLIRQIVLLALGAGEDLFKRPEAVQRWAGEFLSRLDVERVRFPISAELGAVVLAVMNVADGGLMASRGTFGGVAVRIPGVAESLQLLAYGCRVQRRAHRLLLVPNYAVWSDEVEGSDDLMEPLGFPTEFDTDLQFAKVMKLRVG